MKNVDSKSVSEVSAKGICEGTVLTEKSVVVYGVDVVGEYRWGTEGPAEEVCKYVS